jgi:hypothetical protein
MRVALSLLLPATFALAFPGSLQAGDRKPSAGPPKLVALKQARLDAAKAAYKAAAEALRQGQVKVQVDPVYQWSLRWYQAERDLATRSAGVVAAAEGHLARMKSLRTLATQGYRAGQLSQAEALGAEYFVADAKVLLEQARAR